MKIGVLSDAHGNQDAFRAAISHLRNLGASSFYFLGDAIGYIPLLGVVDEIISLGSEVQCIIGNHENMLLGNSAGTGRDSVYKHQLIRERITQEQIAFIKAWPKYLRKTIDGLDILFLHGSPTDYTNEYVYPDSDLTKYEVNEAYVFMGHSHYPFIKRIRGTTFVNVGSCGLPRDDGRYGAFALLDTNEGLVSIYRYDISGIAAKFPQNLVCEIHDSVQKLFSRRSFVVFGTILN